MVERLRALVRHRRLGRWPAILTGIPAVLSTPRALWAAVNIGSNADFLAELVGVSSVLATAGLFAFFFYYVYWREPFKIDIIADETWARVILTNREDTAGIAAAMRIHPNPFGERPPSYEGKWLSYDTVEVGGRKDHVPKGSYVLLGRGAKAILTILERRRTQHDRVSATWEKGPSLAQEFDRGVEEMPIQYLLHVKFHANPPIPPVVRSWILTIDEKELRMRNATPSEAVRLP